MAVEKNNRDKIFSIIFFAELYVCKLQDMEGSTVHVACNGSLQDCVLQVIICLNNGPIIKKSHFRMQYTQALK